MEAVILSGELDSNMLVASVDATNNLESCNIITAYVKAVILSGELESDTLVASVDAINNLES